MSGDGFEYPDEAGYPDGEGLLDEGTAGGDADLAAKHQAAEADTAEVELEEFGLDDEEDVEGV